MEESAAGGPAARAGGERGAAHGGAGRAGRGGAGPAAAGISVAALRGGEPAGAAAASLRCRTAGPGAEEGGGPEGGRDLPVAAGNGSARPRRARIRPSTPGGAA